MNPRPLVEAVLAAVAFLEHSPDDVVDPDSAAQALEDMAGYLGAIREDELPELVAVLAEIATEADEAGDVGWARLVRGLPARMGLGGKNSVPSDQIP